MQIHGLYSVGSEVLHCRTECALSAGEHTSTEILLVGVNLPLENPITLGGGSGVSTPPVPVAVEEGGACYGEKHQEEQNEYKHVAQAGEGHDEATDLSLELLMARECPQGLQHPNASDHSQDLQVLLHGGVSLQQGYQSAKDHDHI